MRTSQAPPQYSTNTLVSGAGGTIVIACWCQREETADTPLSKDEKDKLQFLYDEWVHPYFISNLEFGRLMEVSELASP